MAKCMGCTTKGEVMVVNGIGCSPVKVSAGVGENRTTYVIDMLIYMHTYVIDDHYLIVRSSMEFILHLLLTVLLLWNYEGVKG